MEKDKKEAQKQGMPVCPHCQSNESVEKVSGVAGSVVSIPLEEYHCLKCKKFF